MIEQKMSYCLSDINFSNLSTACYTEKLVGALGRDSVKNGKSHPSNILKRASLSYCSNGIYGVSAAFNCPVLIVLIISIISLF